jgi:hypothetical protein
MARGNILDRHIPGGRLNDKGQLEMPNIEGEAAPKVKYPYMADLDPRTIVVDHRCQAREKTDDAIVSEYGDAMARGDKFPYVTVFFDGTSYWLADGFHRVAAAISMTLPSIQAEVREGGMREAKLFAIGANASHGLRRTNADKRRAVRMLLEDKEWSRRTDNWIAKTAAVHHSTVAALRLSLAKSASEKPTKRLRTDKHGNVSEMDTSRIGKRLLAEPKPDRPASNVVNLADHLDSDDSFEAIEAEVEKEMAVQSFQEDLEDNGIDPDAIDKPDVRARAIASAISDLAMWQMTPEAFWGEYNQWYSRIPVLEDLPVAMNVLKVLMESSDGFLSAARKQKADHHARLLQGGNARSGEDDLGHEEG